MEIEDINYRTLRRIQQLEKTQPLLTKIDQQFYQHLNQYLKNLEKTVEKEQNQQKKKLFADELENTKKIANNIYELREKKIVQAALSHVRGGKPETKYLLSTEKTLYDALIKLITNSRDQIMQQKIPPPTQYPPEEPPLKEEKPQKNMNQNPIIRVTETIPEFVGTDMKTYFLRKDDVLSLPEDMSKTLVKRNVGKQIQ